MFNKMINKKNIIEIILMVFPLVAAISAILFGIQYHIWDDDYMNWISKGLFANTPDEHLLFINVCLGYFLKGLYTVCNSINWYPLFFVCLIIVSSYAFLFCIKRYIKYYYAALITILFELFLLFNLTFTCLGIIVSAIAVIVMTDLWNNKSIELKSFIFAIAAMIILFECGLMLRKDSVEAALLICLPLLVISGIKNIKNKRMWITLIIIAILSSSVLFINSRAYSSEEWHEWKEYNNARGQILDYPIADYNKNENEYKKIGISPNDYKCIYLNNMVNYSFSDKQFFSKKRLDNILEITSTQKRYNLNIIDYFKKIISLKLFILFLAICIYFMFVAKGKRRLFYALQIIVTFGTLSYLVAINRFVEKVYCPLLVISILVASYEFAKEKKERRTLNTVIACILMGLSCLWTVNVVNTNAQIYKSYEKESKSYGEVTSYIESDKSENLYVMDLYFFGRLYYRKPIFQTGNKSIKNVIPLLDCYTYAPFYYKHINKYSLKYNERMNLNLAENKNIFYVDWDKKKDILVKYIEEHTHKKIKTQVVKRMNNRKVTIYKMEYRQ